MVPSRQLAIVRLGHYKGAEPGGGLRRAVGLLMAAIPPALWRGSSGRNDGRPATGCCRPTAHGYRAPGATRTGMGSPQSSTFPAGCLYQSLLSLRCRCMSSIAAKAGLSDRNSCRFTR